MALNSPYATIALILVTLVLIGIASSSGRARPLRFTAAIGLLLAVAGVILYTLLG